MGANTYVFKCALTVHFHIHPAQAIDVTRTEIHFCFLLHFVKSRKLGQGMTLKGIW